MWLLRLALSSLVQYSASTHPLWLLLASHVVGPLRSASAEHATLMCARMREGDGQSLGPRDRCEEMGQDLTEHFIGLLLVLQLSAPH